RHPFENTAVYSRKFLTKVRLQDTSHVALKLLREHQLEAGTIAAQQEELERRRRLDEQRKQDYPIPLLPEYAAATASLACLDSSSIRINTNASNVIDLSKGVASPHVCSKPADEEEDVEPSDAHANDAQNQPDIQGRVLVNLNHPAAEKDIYLSPQLARAVKPHQIGGIRFLYDNLVESLELFDNSSGLGCILAHSMGLGKTLQVISFIDILFRHTRAHTVLAIVPVNTLQNWLSEFNTWVPPPEALPPDTDPLQVAPRTFKVHILNDEHKNTASRAKVVEEWARDGGVLLMGYEMYRLLSLKKSFVAGRKKRSKKSAEPDVLNLVEEDRQQELLKGIEKALSRPGPDVVICDEGHRIKNCHASTSQALKNIQTRRRVVLTGYPLQNNLIEYWCMVDFVRPDFLGTRQEFSNMFERPILNGQCVDSTPQDIQLMRYRSHVLHSLLEGFVQRRGHDVLRDQLPSKQEHVLLVRLSPLQRALYTEFMNRFREAGSTGWLSLNPLKAFCVCCKIWNHPDVLYEALQKENLASEQDLDLDDITSAGHPRCPTASLQKSKNLDGPDPIGGLSLSQLQEKANQVITYEWAKDIMCDYKPGILENSGKMVLLFHLIEESVRKGDKLLVFSQSLSTLTVIEEFLAKRPVPPSPYSASKDKPNQSWVRNLNYYRLDGSTTASERERLINQFNDPTNTSAWVFLLSTRAGCLGVNLIGANRVVVFDASWNPCHDAQAVCRVYRYGQRKPCQIYRLVCDFTLEKKIYDRQISKQGMSDRVVDDLNPVLTFTRREVECLLHFVEEEPDPSQVLLQPEGVEESVLQKALHLYSHLVTKQPFPHESLLLDRREPKLSSAEKKAAKRAYEEEKRASVPYTRPSYAHYYPASDQSLTNIPAFSQRNWSVDGKEKPVANVRPVQSASVPMVSRQVSGKSPPDRDSSKSGQEGFNVNCLQKAGVFVQKIVTTTDIMIPGTNRSIDAQARITSGESIHVIRGTKGTYIRTSDGRIFAIRAANKAKTVDESDGSTNHSNGCLSPERKQLGSSKVVARPVSPDSPGIIDELQSYTGGAGDEAAAESSLSPLPPNELLQANGSSVSHRDVTVTKIIQPNMDATAAQDLRVGAKRKASTPSLEEQVRKQPFAGKPFSAPLSSQGFPFSGGYGLPPVSLVGAAPTSSLSSSTATTPLPPFLLNPSMPGMLPPGFPLSYSPSLASLYSGSMLQGGVSGPAATPGPAGASFLSQYPPTAASSSSSSSPSSISPPARSEGQRASVLVNGRDVSSNSSSEEDDDVIEVRGE
uniref:RAD54 like 2 n=1 Tax=Nothobranchius furzeri TaxID=105023 RepID=A0A8C6LPC2_NOTFU